MSDLSRVEQLLRNALGEDIYEVTPQSRVEALLVELNELIEGISASVEPEELTPIITAWLAENIHDGAVVDASLSVAGAAAEAQKTGNEISQLKEDLNNYTGKRTYSTADFNSMTENGYYIITTAVKNIANTPVQANNGAMVFVFNSITQGGLYQILFVNNNTIYYRRYWASNWSDWIRIPTTEADKNRYVKAEEINPAFTTISDFNDAEVNSIYSFTDSNRMGQLANMPIVQGGTLFTFNANGSQNSLIKTQMYITSTGAIYIRACWGEWRSWRKALYNEEFDASLIVPSVGLFEKIGVIGDSYASGQVYITGGPVNHYNFSWGQIMARRNGATCVNFSQGGLTTKTWLSSDKGLTLLLSEDAQDLYIIALGINDRTDIRNETYSIGTDADFDLSDYANTPDTFYGNMCKIIGNIQTKAPNSKIILSTMAINASGVYQDINTAIMRCAELASIPVIKQHENAFFTSSFYVNGKVGGHPTAPVYSGMAVAIERMIGKSMIDNYTYFYDYVGQS